MRHINGPPESPLHESDPPSMCPAQNIPSVMFAPAPRYDFWQTLSAIIGTLAACSVTLDTTEMFPVNYFIRFTIFEGEIIDCIPDVALGWLLIRPHPLIVHSIPALCWKSDDGRQRG